MSESIKSSLGWLQSAHVNKAEVDRAYELLEFCDALSLIICQEIVPPEGRRVEIGCGSSGTTYLQKQM
ncbi:DUF3891 family protein [Pedobacter sp. WC2501]|uniref:DUF3891 family protein n=1 Tax=Pedobacter sp. WC2501 TaxID=3461400 RepID=UPI004046397A